MFHNIRRIYERTERKIAGVEADCTLTPDISEVTVCVDVEVRKVGRSSESN